MPSLSEILGHPLVAIALSTFTTLTSVMAVYSNAILVRAHGDADKAQRLFDRCAHYIIPSNLIIAFIASAVYLSFFKGIGFSIIIALPLFVVALVLIFYVPLTWTRPVFEIVPWTDKLFIKYLPKINRRIDEDMAVIIGRSAVSTLTLIVFVITVAAFAKNAS